MNDRPGLAVTDFIAPLSDQSIRQLLSSDVLSVLDALFEGRIEGSELRNVANTLVDLDLLIRQSNTRELILDLIPEHKKKELEHRVQRSNEEGLGNDWSEMELRRLREFFGLIDETFPTPPIATEETVVASYGLFEHQRGAVEGLLPLLCEGERRAVLHMPTGAGKTRTAMHVVAHFLRENDPSLVIWLASGTELLEQAIEGFKEAWTHLGTRPAKVGVVQGDRVPDLSRFSDGFLAVGLAKGWALRTGTHKDWAVKTSPFVRLVVFDEAHQSIARTYRQLTNELTMHFRCALLGLTATPGRTWSDIDEDGRLAEFYGRNKVTIQVPGDDPIQYLIENGYLARPKFRTLFAKPGLAVGEIDLSRIASALDIPDDLLSSLSMSDQYVAAVLEAVESLLRKGHSRILVFAASVAIANILSAVLVARNTPSVSITGLTPARVRDHAVRMFKSKREGPLVLVNYGVLTTGIDVPEATGVVVARPTKSLVLYSQMVGRAIRGPKAGGTENCEIVTVVDPRLPGFGSLAQAFVNWEEVWK